MPKVFLSHSHSDKTIARRIARFLQRHHVDAWIDERELRLGTRLDDSICTAIRQSDVVIVVATEAAAQSAWVEREVKFASDAAPPVAVCPVYLDNVISHPSFAPHLGIDATDRCRFSEVLTTLAQSLVGSTLPASDEGRLQAELDELARGRRAVALLADSCLRGQGLLYEHVALVAELPFHELDEALDLVSLLGGASPAAHATAALFKRTGAGSAAIRRYLAAGHDLLNSAVGVELDPAAFGAAMRLLSEHTPGHDQALASFLWKNGPQLTNLRGEVLRLVTHPDRGPAGFGADAAAAAFDVFPDDDDLVLLWSRWIRQGMFDLSEEKGADTPQSLAFWCTRGMQKGSGGWNRVFDGLRRHVRSLARAKDKNRVRAAIDHMQRAADKENPRFQELVQECEGACGAAEWDRWEHREQMSHYVTTMTSEARGERKWGEALRRAVTSWKEREEFDRLLEESPDPDAEPMA